MTNVKMVVVVFVCGGCIRNRMDHKIRRIILISYTLKFTMGHHKHTGPCRRKFIQGHLCQVEYSGEGRNTRQERQEEEAVVVRNRREGRVVVTGSSVGRPAVKKNEYCSSQDETVT